MSEDQKRDPEGLRASENGDAVFGARRGADDASRADGGETPASDEAATDNLKDHVKTPPPMDDDAVAKHRAAKEARIRKRMEERNAQQDDAPGPKRGGKGHKKGKFSALPALRPDIKADTPALRAERVEAIRRDLVRRRRRKGGTMLLRLWFMVLVPTALVAWFMWFKAADLYKSESKFMVQSADSTGGASGGGLLGAFLGGGGGGAIFDPNAVQTFVTSRDVLRRLDEDHAWIAHFQNPDLDFLHRIDSDATFEEAYDRYRQMIEVSFDPTEGILEMGIIGADAETAQRFNYAVIGYAEEMVNQLSSRIREDAMADSERNLVDSEERLRVAQEAVAELQKTLDTFSVEGEVTAEMGIISGMEVELEGLRGRLANLRRVTSEDDPRVERIRNQVETLERQISERRDNITGDRGEDGASLADINLALTKARFEVEAATAIFSAAVQRREVARANSQRQHRYLAVIASPSMPDSANYPKKPQMTALAFLGFLGFYIIGSLTLSLIREQASI